MIKNKINISIPFSIIKENFTFIINIIYKNILKVCMISVIIILIMENKKIIQFFSGLKYWYIQLPENFKPAIFTSVATLSGAFLGASIAQYVSHRLALKRENKKYYIDAYQKFYSPIIFDIYSYIDKKTAFGRSNLKVNFDENVVKDKILGHIGNNIMYATPDIIKAYNKVRIYSFRDDFSGFIYYVDVFMLFETFLNGFRNLLDKTKIYDKEAYSIVVKYSLLYNLWYIYIHYFHGFPAATNLLTYKYYFSNESYTLEKYNKIHAKYKEYPENNNLKYNLNYIFKTLSDKGKIGHLLSALDECNKMPNNEPIKQNDFIALGISDVIENITFNNNTLVINLKIYNYTKKLLRININDFILKTNISNFDRKKIQPSGFYDGSDYFPTRTLLETESVNIRLIYNLDFSYDSNFLELYFVYNDQSYKIINNKTIKKYIENIQTHTQK